MYKINEVAKKCSISQRMLRHFEDLGLIEPGREENSYRSYSEQDLIQISRIQFYQQLGFSLKEIKDMELQKGSNFSERIEKLKERKEHEIEEQRKQYLDILTVEKRFQSGDMTSAQLPLLSVEDRNQLIEEIKFGNCVVQGPFPELENFEKHFSLGTKQNSNYEIKIISSNFWKFGEWIRQLGSGTFDVHELKNYYCHLLLWRPESFAINFDSKNSEALTHLFNLFTASWKASVSDLSLDFIGTTDRLSVVMDLFATRDVILEFCFQVKSDAGESIVNIVLPYGPLHHSKQQGQTALDGLSKSISTNICSLEKQVLFEKLMNLPNRDFLFTITLANQEARSKLFSMLSEKAEKMAQNDLLAFRETFEKFWKV